MDIQKLTLVCFSVLACILSFGALFIAFSASRFERSLTEGIKALQDRKITFEESGKFTSLPLQPLFRGVLTFALKLILERFLGSSRLNLTKILRR